MRIDLVTRFSPLTQGGTQRLVRDLAVAISGTCDVRVLAARADQNSFEWRGRFDRVPPWPPQYIQPGGIPIEYYGLSRHLALALAPIVYSPNRYIPGRAWQLYRALLDRGFERTAGHFFYPYHRGRDVVHRIGGSSLALGTVRSAHRAGVPVVINPLAHRDQWDDDPLSALAYREADVVIAESASARQIYLDLGVSPERLVIGRHTSPEPEKGSGAERRGAHRITGPLVLFIGGSDEYKGGTLLLAVAARMAHTRPDVTFVFVGRGHGGELSNVVMAGEVEDEEKRQWLDAATMLVLPSRNESYGLVIDEAWAAGIPVVTSDIPELAGRVALAEAGVAVPRNVDDLERAITDLLDQPARRSALGDAGKRYWAAHLSPEAYADWHLDIYRSLSSPGSRRSGRPDGAAR